METLRAGEVVARAQTMQRGRKVEERDAVRRVRQSHLAETARLRDLAAACDDVTDAHLETIDALIAWLEELCEDPAERRRTKTAERVRRFRERERQEPPRSPAAAP